MEIEQTAELTALKAQLADAEERIELLERIVTASIVLSDDALRRFAVDLLDFISADVPFHGKLPSEALARKITEYQGFLRRLVTDDEFADRVRFRKEA